MDPPQVVSAKLPRLVVRSGLALKTTLCGLTTIMGLCGSIHASESHEASHILDRLSAAIEMPGKLMIDGQNELRVTGAIRDPTLPALEVLTFRYFKEGIRLDIDRALVQYDQNGNIVREGYGAQVIGLEDCVMEFHRFPDIDLGWGTYTQRDLHTGRNRLRRFQNYSEALEGFLAADIEPVWEVMKDSDELRLLPEAQTVDEHKCVVLTARCPGYGTYTLWLDPAAQYLPRKASVIKGIGDLFYDNIIGEPPPQLPPGVTSKGARYPEDPIVRLSFDMTDVELVHLQDGTPIIKAAETRMVQTHQNGEQVLFVMSHFRKAMELNPDFRALGAFQPRRATPILLRNKDFPSIMYEWRDGSAAPRVSGEMQFVIDQDIRNHLQKRADPATGEARETINVSNVRSPSTVTEERASRAYVKIVAMTLLLGVLFIVMLVALLRLQGLARI